ncbi:MAG: helix-turn-helix domain-containing protein [Scytonema sp. PMC 1069.18]|nr:helix-turn-helix domain-containing protein [Scytonema sp. PMC 1069.18]MEC4885001.1 helix-turn-helix domain-containing protein [Scytonema sp. PMC 1070.18]
MNKEELRKLALQLKASGQSVQEIIKDLGISKATLYRWINEESQKKNETPYKLTNSLNPTIKPDLEIFENPSTGDWFIEAIKYCDEIATQSRELRLLLHTLLKEHLEKESLNSRLISSLSTALERHTDIEWRARGLDFLDGNRAITRVLTMGYEISDTSTVTTQE